MSGGRQLGNWSFFRSARRIGGASTDALGGNASSSRYSDSVGLALALICTSRHVSRRWPVRAFFVGRLFDGAVKKPFLVPAILLRLWCANLRRGGLRATAIAEALGIGRASVYRGWEWTKLRALTWLRSFLLFLRAGKCFTESINQQCSSHKLPSSRRLSLRLLQGKSDEIICCHMGRNAARR